MILTRPTEDDIDEVILMSKMIHEESRFKKYNFDPEKVVEMYYTMMSQPTTIAAIVKNDNKAVGMFFGLVSEFYFGRDLQASDLILYVKPQYRKTRAGVMLVQHYITEAKSAGAKQIVQGTTTGIDAEQFGRFLNKMGFDALGSIYIMEE